MYLGSSVTPHSWVSLGRGLALSVSHLLLQGITEAPVGYPEVHAAGLTAHTATDCHLSGDQQVCVWGGRSDDLIVSVVTLTPSVQGSGFSCFLLGLLETSNCMGAGTEPSCVWP